MVDWSLHRASTTADFQLSLLTIVSCKVKVICNRTVQVMASNRWSKVVTATFLALANAQNQPLLSTIATVPALSTFSSVVNMTGGFQPNPALEERFNAAVDGRNYTALVPTNDVRGLIPSIIQSH